MALVELARFHNSFEAGLAKSRLDADGILSILFDFNTSMEGASFLVPIRLMVDEEDAVDAAEILSRDTDEWA